MRRLTPSREKRRIAEQTTSFHQAAGKSPASELATSQSPRSPDAAMRSPGLCELANALAQPESRPLAPMELVIAR